MIFILVASVEGFEVELELGIDGADFECALAFEGSDEGRYISVSIESRDAYGSAYVDGGDAGISNNLNMRIVHIASSRDLVFEYQPDGDSEWTELARLNLGNGAFNGAETEFDARSSGEGFSGELVSASQRLSLVIEVEAGQATQTGDLTIGGISITVPLELVESKGNTALLKNENGYFIGDESRSLKYEGAQLGNIAGWTYLGVESDESTGYHMMIRNDGTGEYVRWTLDSSGNIISGGLLER